MFAVQDEITAAVSRQSSRRSPMRNCGAAAQAAGEPGAWEAYQRGLWHLWKADATDIERAREFLQRAINLDATFAPAYASMAYAYRIGGLTYAIRPLQEAAELGHDWARKAIEIDPNDADAQATLGWAMSMAGNLDGAFERTVHWRCR